MTCGIYSLQFNGLAGLYIGQSVNIENRYKQHLSSFRNKAATLKLQDAYDTYGIPCLTILLECSSMELDINEDEAISIFNSKTLGLNTYSSSNEAPTYSGHGYGNSKYSKEEIIACVDLLLLDGLVSYTSISEITGVNISTITKLANTTTHQWVWDTYPYKYEKMLHLLKARDENRYKEISSKLSAKSKGIVYPSICCPKGTVYKIDNAYQFAKLNGLAPNHFQEVLNGHRKSHKGWKLA